MGQWQGASIIDSTCAPSHVLLPSIGSGLTATTGLFLASKGSSDLSTRSADVGVHYATVTAQWSYPSLVEAQISREERRRKTLRHTIVDSDSFFKRLEPNHVQDGHEKLLLQDLSARVDLNNGWSYIVASHALNDGATVQNFAALTLGLGHALLEDLYLSLCLQRTDE